MDYETEQLDAYERADAERFLSGFAQKPEPQLFGVPLSDLQDASEKVTSGAAFLGREAALSTVGAFRNAAQSAINLGADLLEAEGEKFLNNTGLRKLVDGDPESISLNIPRPRLPEVAEPKTFAGGLARDFIQFGVGYLASPNKFGALNPILRSGIADAAFFDPAEGGFIRPLIDLDILPEAVEFLAADEVDETSSAQERLKARLQMAQEGALAGGMVDGVIKTLAIIKNDPRLLRASVLSLGAALDASPATKQTRAIGSTFGAIGAIPVTKQTPDSPVKKRKSAVQANTKTVGAQGDLFSKTAP